MSKKILSVLLTLCMLLGMFPVVLPVGAAETAEEDALSEVVQYTEIADADALADLMADSTKWAGNYKLTADIDLTGKTQSPIGNSTTAFTGTFDGDNHKIEGLALETTTTDTGLFGRVNGNAVIKNLTVYGNVTTSNSRSGGLIGQVYGGNVTVTNCVNHVDVDAAGGGAGGIVGTFAGVAAGNTLTITDCTNYGDVTGKQYNGGVFGFVSNSKTNITVTVDNCKNYGAISTTTGNVCGGIFGYANHIATSGTTHLLSPTAQTTVTLTAEASPVMLAVL